MNEIINFTKMNPKVKAKWLEALRSGNYKQGKHQLKDTRPHYCCLGVLCELYPDISWVDNGDNRFAIDDVDDPDHTGMPSRKIFEWSNLNRSDAAYLTELNDTEGKTFLEIADYIEGAL